MKKEVKKDLKEKKTKKVTTKEKIKPIVIEAKEEINGKPKKRNFWLYCLLMIFLFIIVVEILTSIGGTLLGYFINNVINRGKNGFNFYLELICTFIVVLIMLASGNSYVFTCKKEGFFKSLKKGWPMLIMSIVTLIYSIISIASDEFNFLNFISLILFCLSIGLFEEFLCRGWLLNEFLERFGSTKKGVISSLIASSVIFGLMHLTNIFATTYTVTMVILQIINAVALGFFLSSLYYKTKNIWSVIFYHAFWDFAIMLSEYNLLAECEYSGAMSTPYLVFLSISLLLSSIYFIISSILILKSDDKTKKNNMLVLTIIALFLICNIYDYALNKINIDSGDYSQTCYDFRRFETDEYSTFYYHYDSYDINIRRDYTVDSITYNEEILNLNVYINDDNEAVIKNRTTGEEVKLYYNYVTELLVFENDDNYEILVVTYDGGVYYSKYINKFNADNTIEYMNNIKNSFTGKHFPEIFQVGYMQIKGETYKYPYLVSEIDGRYIIDKDGTESVVKSDN